MTSYIRFTIILAFGFTVSACALTSPTKPKVTPLIKASTSWDGKPIIYPAGQAEITGLMVEIAPGNETGWHLHPVPSFGLIMEGTLEVTLKNGKMKRFNEGEALVEVVNTLHNGRNVGNKPLKILVFYSGVVGNKLTFKQPE